MKEGKENDEKRERLSIRRSMRICKYVLTTIYSCYVNHKQLSLIVKYLATGSFTKHTQQIVRSSSNGGMFRELRTSRSDLCSYTRLFGVAMDTKAPPECSGRTTKKH